MKTSLPSAGGTRRAGLAVGLVAAGVFLALTTLHLEAQGPYYDELHQATGAFTWVGSAPDMFCHASWGRACLLNMSYSGAIKTNLYGAYLRLGSRHFSLSTWRLFGIVPVALAIAVFCAITYPVLSGWSLAVFIGLLVTDVNLLLSTRFDAGPVALALAARLLLIALWLRGHATEAPASARNSCALGAVTGLAIFEKLSSVVLIAALLIAWLLGDGGRRTARHLRAMAAGLALGVTPLVAINALTLVSHQRLVSVADVVASDPPSAGWLVHAARYVSLAQGTRVGEWMLGVPARTSATGGEAMLIVLVGLVIVIVAVRPGAPPKLRLAGALMATWGVMAVGLYLLPRRIGVHHLIIGTPFQYAAVAVALTALPVLRRRSERMVRACLILLVAALIVLRLVTLWPVETSLVHGRFGPAWDPSLRQLGLFAASRRDAAVFVASDWGVATQIYCYADGQPGVVYEPFWLYRDVGQLHDFQRRSGKDTLYVVRLSRPAMVRPEATKRIERDLATDPAWREVETEAEARDLRAVSIRKYIYRPAVTPG